MASVAKVIRDVRAAAPGAEVYLGPAEVVHVSAGEVKVELDEGAVVEARLALALPYEPVLGDILLVIGKGGDHYAIGVLKGAGSVALAILGDVTVHAVGGKLKLAGDEGVEVDGPELVMRTGKLQTIAGSIVQTAASFYQRVTSLLSVQAKEVSTVVEETSRTHAKNVAITTGETVTINGRRIHLG